jgi:hypothetical protein
MKNFLESLVTEIYDELRARTPGACGCDACRTDVMAFVLNNTRPRYSGGADTGRALISLDMQKDQTRAEIAVMVLDAMQRVAANPRHAPHRPSGGTPAAP